MVRCEREEGVPATPHPWAEREVASEIKGLNLPPAGEEEARKRSEAFKMEKAKLREATATFTNAR